MLQPEILKPLMIEAVRLNTVMNLRIRFLSVGVNSIGCLSAHPTPGITDHTGGRVQLAGISQQKHHRARDSFQDAGVFTRCSRPRDSP